jgi:nicotinamidase-related amidase
MSDEAALAELLDFVLAGRPERLSDLAVSQMPPAERSALRSVTEAIAALGLNEVGIAPSPSLRDRVLASARKHLPYRPRRAVLVCDMIRDHLTPGRALEVPRARSIVPALVVRLAKARADGEPIVYVLDQHEPGDPELDVWSTHAVKGTQGAEVWPPLAPAAGDRVVTKPSYSGFFETQLERVLDELNIDTIVLTGCATEVQLMATATDALHRGFAVEIPGDSQAGMSDVAEQVTLGVLAALVPYAPARAARLQRAASTAG